MKSEVPYCVTSPSVPDKITFAGQAIDLLRYDHRERMDRELMSFTYMHSTTMLMVKRANRYFPAWRRWRYVAMTPPPLSCSRWAVHGAIPDTLSTGGG